MSIEEKEVKIIDLNLFSGSADTYRTAMGGYFETAEVDTTDTTTEGEEVVFDEFIWNSIKTPWVGYVMPDSWSTVGQVQTISNDIIIPNKKVAIRNWASSDDWQSDIFWKTFWLGGSYGDETYPAVYNETVWDDYWLETAFPYSQLETNALVEKTSVTNVIQVSCEYNYYLPEYQTYVDGLGSELLIPNMYLIEMFNNGLDISATTDPEGLFTTEDSVTSRVFNGDIQKFVSLEGLYESDTDDSNTMGNINKLFADKDTTWAPDLPNYTLHGYLSQSVPLTSLSASTTDYVQNALQNVFFDQHSIYGGTVNPTFINMETNKDLFPYYININFPARSALSKEAHGDSAYRGDFEGRRDQYGELAFLGLPTAIAESIENNNYSSKFLKTLKEAFLGEINSLEPITQDYALSRDYQTSSVDSTVDDQVVTVETTSLRSVDYLELLTYAYNNYLPTTNNCYFVGEKLIDREIAMDDSGAYRYLNSKNALRTVEDIIAKVGGGILEDPAEMFDTEMSFEDLLNGWRGENTGKYNETIAYRIEKIGGPGTGDSQTQNVLQNFWIFNSLNLDDVKLFDSQVKYGQDYTYNIYAYVITSGVKYKFSDLRLTRQINYNEDSVTTPYCLEWYDPTTDESADQLAPYDDDVVPNPLGDEESAENSPEGSLSNSIFPGMADFYVNYEPSVRLKEIPIFSKTLKVLDNPTNQLSIDPFYLLDASQTLGYETRYETFIQTLFPKIISAADETLKQEYLNAKDLLEADDLTEESVSQQRYLEVYRLSDRPGAYTDFDNNLISTIDLKLEDSTYTLPSTIFYDMINTNQKYYYVFRVLNENRILGQLSEIYEAELINDGGYTYSNFEVLFEEDLEEDVFTNPSISFKKLIQLQPNISQIALNDENIDYSDLASSQITNMTLGNADDTMWNKTFKIRLTSKKTGKKVDLNVTYKYEYDSN